MRRRKTAEANERERERERESERANKNMKNNITFTEKPYMHVYTSTFYHSNHKIIY